MPDSHVKALSSVVSLPLNFTKGLVTHKPKSLDADLSILAFNCVLYLLLYVPFNSQRLDMTKAVYWDVKQ